MNAPARARAALFTAILLVAGCAEGSGPSSSPSNPVPGPAPEVEVEVRLEAAAPIRVVVRRASPGEALATFLPGGPPPEDWTRLIGVAEGGGRLQIDRPRDAYPDAEARVYVADDGEAAIGLFRPSDPSMPPHVRRRLEAPILGITTLRAVEIRTSVDEDSPPPAIAEVATVRVAVGQQPPTVLSRSQLEAIPLDADPRRGQPAWKLLDLVRFTVAPRYAGAITIEAEGAAPVRFEAERLADPMRPIMIRPNRRGALVVHAFGPPGPNAVGRRGHGARGPELTLRDVRVIRIE